MTTAFVPLCFSFLETKEKIMKHSLTIANLKHMKYKVKPKIIVNCANRLSHQSKQTNNEKQLQLKITAYCYDNL